jgi:glycosyltransferase involved in cell wall biosynthesis
MKIAVVDHVGNKGGVSRVVRKLLPAMAKINRNISITYFSSPLSINREKINLDFKKYNINIKYLYSLYFLSNYNEKNYLKKFFFFLQKKIFNRFFFLPPILTGNLNLELKIKLKNFDLIYFPWPYLIELPKIKKPMVATFHDFNFKYYFSGTPTYSSSQINFLNKQMEIWLNNVSIIVSNNFTMNELKKFYPNLNRKINVIPLGAYSDINSIKTKDFKNIKKKFNLPERYIFCGTNTCAHKNLNPLFAAMNILKKKHQHLNLVLTGPGTEIINGISDEYGVQLNDIKRDVYGLGYVHNDELELIIENAQLIINPEMYTSDNGPATDGWAKGKPVIIADIPSNREHINNQFVYAELFNFRDPEDIANKIEKIVNNKDNKYINYASKSKISISNVKWEAVAENYLKVFNQK